MLGLELDDLAVDGCITKAPSGGEVAGRSPVDRGKQGRKRSVVTEGTGLPLHLVAAGANRHDAPLLEPTLAGLDKLDWLPDELTVHLDRGYDSHRTRALLAALDFDGAIARKSVPAPRPGRCAMGRRAHLQLDERLRQAPLLHREAQLGRRLLPLIAAALVVLRQLIQRAGRRYSWPSRPTTRRLK
jgi:hypothetical protein